jgi:hypothetical protein
MALQQLLMFGAAFVAQAGSTDSNSSLRANFEGRYAALKAAMASKDEKAIRSLLAAGFVSVDADGKSEDAAHMIKEVLALPADPNRQSQTTILSVKGDERAAVVTQRYDMTKTVQAPDGSEKAIALATISTDKWVNENGSWRIARTATTQLDYTVDGVTVAHKEKATTK